MFKPPDWKGYIGRYWAKRGGVARGEWVCCDPLVVSRYDCSRLEPTEVSVRVLRSFVQGQWTAGTGEGSTLLNAVNGEPVATASTEGIDRGEALAWARRVGGPTLRSMTFIERGDALRAMARVIHGARDELIDLSRENYGATRGDAKFDIDGGSGTMAFYGGIGKSLGDRSFLLDGPSEAVRGARFVGQHVRVPRRGVAIHINAFNFPAWGMCEKLSASILAGVPALVKPGTATCLATARIVELWHEAGVLPPGAVSLLCGSVGDLLDHLEYQDVVAFTGGSVTARKIRGHQRVIDLNIPVNIEADSLNAAVLGPDVAAGSETALMFVGDVAKEITQKAGQKCTAVRRIFVPEGSWDWVRESLVERLGDISVGDPADRANRMGPVASAAQYRDVLSGVRRLSEVSEVAFGGSEVPEGGFYVAPHLFVTDKGAAAPIVHEEEVFGPVATVLIYGGDAEEVVELVALGGGGLVASMYTDDRSWGGDVLLGIAPWHGRVVWGSKKIGDQSMGSGTVLPGFVHGGPGKAGGGEELGGVRGLTLYTQRVAVQGDRGNLEKILGRWTD